MILDRLQARLSSWHDDGLYRPLHELQSPMQADVINSGKNQRVFCASNYLGLANHPRLKKAMIAATEKMGVGTGASHLVVGHHALHKAAEDAFATQFGFESAMLFSCGYMANLGIQQALLNRNDVAYHDRLNHASLLDGARLSGAKLKRFRHLDYAQLEQQLQQDSRSSQFVASDTVFSMRGDKADLSALVALRKKHGFFLLLDDAHGVGVVGNEGRGSLDKAGLTARDVDILVCPLGKAFGSFGAMVMGERCVIDALRQFSRSYVYSTAMPAALAAVAKESLQVMQDEPWRHARLRELIAYFKKTAQHYSLSLLPSDSAIQAFVVGDTQRCSQLADYLQEKGFLITAIRKPTVPVGEEQLRFAINVGQTEADIDALLATLAAGVSNAD